jgi:hypothetical protein
MRAHSCIAVVISGAMALTRAALNAQRISGCDSGKGEDNSGYELGSHLENKREAGLERLTIDSWVERLIEQADDDLPVELPSFYTFCERCIPSFS